MAESNKSKVERRRFPRVRAPVFYRSPRILSPKRRIADISPSGVRIYSDKHFEEGKRLEIEFFLPTGYSVVTIARVVWIKKLPPDSEGLYDVGLEFIHVPPPAINELKSLLKNTSTDE